MFRSLCTCVQSLGECAFESKNNQWNIFFPKEERERERARERERNLCLYILLFADVEMGIVLLIQHIGTTNSTFIHTYRLLSPSLSLSLSFAHMYIEVYEYPDQL